MELPHTRRVVELKIPSELGYEKIAREAVATVAKNLGFDDSQIADIKLAVAEACTNAISHGGQSDSLAKIMVVLTADDKKLDILVKDPGFNPPPTNPPVPDIHKMVNGETRLGGMGLYIIEKLVDKAEFVEGDDDSGNQFHMVIYRMDDDDSESEPDVSADIEGENA